MKKKLAIVTTHPIQYNAPLFKVLALSDVMDIKVFYTWSQAKESVKDVEFGRKIVWDIPLLDGYNYEWIENVSKKPKQCFQPKVDSCSRKVGAECYFGFRLEFSEPLQSDETFSW